MVTRMLLQLPIKRHKHVFTVSLKIELTHKWHQSDYCSLKRESEELYPRMMKVFRESLSLSLTSFDKRNPSYQSLILYTAADKIT